MKPIGIINVSLVSCHLSCALQLLINGMEPLSHSLRKRVGVGRYKNQGRDDSFLILLGTFIDDYYCASKDSESPMDPSRLYNALMQNPRWVIADHNNPGDAVTAFRRILQMIRAASTTDCCSSSSLHELFNVLLRGTVRQDIMGRKGFLQRIKSKDREMANPMSIPGTASSVEDGLAQATIESQLINGFDWEQTSDYVETEQSLPQNDHIDGDVDTWETLKTIRFVSLPHCMFFHLDRFAHGMDGSHRLISDTMDIPKMIDMSKYLYLADDHATGSEHQYSLKGVILHVLEKDSDDECDEGGHYVSVNCMEDNRWYLVDDDIVTPIASTNIVLDFVSGRPCSVETSKNCMYIAVLLLYCCQGINSTLEHLVENDQPDELTDLSVVVGQDEDHCVIGKRVKVKWARGKWYSGVISGYNEDTGKHRVTYDDGDERVYNLKKKDIVWE